MIAKDQSTARYRVTQRVAGLEEEEEPEGEAEESDTNNMRKNKKINKKDIKNKPIRRYKTMITERKRKKEQQQKRNQI